jgi:hypothetical protein
MAMPDGIKIAHSDRQTFKTLPLFSRRDYAATEIALSDNFIKANVPQVYQII